MLDSIASLRKSVEAYDKEADAHEWERLSRAHEDIVSLKRRATGASLSSFPKEGRSTAMGNFSTVALEYSKLLDVLMNQCPVSQYRNLSFLSAVTLQAVAHVAEIERFRDLPGIMRDQPKRQH